MADGRGRVLESFYHVFSAAAGVVAGVACIVGFVILVVRRAYFPRVRRTTSPTDLAVYVLLGAVIILGLVETVGVNVLGPGYDYRPTVGAWFRGIFWLHPDPMLMASAPLVYQLHAASAWLLFALWPFSRLVHAWRSRGSSSAGPTSCTGAAMCQRGPEPGCPSGTFGTRPRPRPWPTVGRWLSKGPRPSRPTSRGS